MEEKDLNVNSEESQEKTALTINEFGRQALQVVKNASLLTTENMEALAEMREELQHTYEHKQMWRTECEIRNSVLVDSKFPTPDAKYWQAVREQDVFFNELVRLSYQYRQAQQDIKIAEAKKLKLEDDLGKAQMNNAPDYEIMMLEAKVEKQTISLDEKVFNAKNMQLAARDRMREIKIWSTVKDELEQHLQHGTDSPNDHQSHSYLLRFVNMVRNAQANNFQGCGASEINNMISQFENLVKDPKNAEEVEKLGLGDMKESLERERRRMTLALGYDEGAAKSIGHMVAPKAIEEAASRPLIDMIKNKLEEEVRYQPKILEEDDEE